MFDAQSTEGHITIRAKPNCYYNYNLDSGSLFVTHSTVEDRRGLEEMIEDERIGKAENRWAEALSAGSACKSIL